MRVTRWLGSAPAGWASGVSGVSSARVAISSSHAACVSNAMPSHDMWYSLCAFRPGPGCPKPEKPNLELAWNFPASLFLNMRRILYQNAWITMLKTRRTVPAFFRLNSCWLLNQKSGEMKNFTNTGLAQSGFEEPGPARSFFVLFLFLMFRWCSLCQGFGFL